MKVRHGAFDLKQPEATRSAQKLKRRSLLPKEEKSVLRAPHLRPVSSSLKWALYLTSVRRIRQSGTIPGRHPQRLDFFSYLDKRRSLGQQHLSVGLKQVSKNILLEFNIENTVSKGSKPELHEVLSLLSVKIIPTLSI